MVTWDESDNEKSSSSNDEQANIYLMANKNDKVEVKTCSKSDVLLQNYHMISFRSKKFKEKFKAFTSENTELKKPNQYPEKKR